MRPAPTAATAALALAAVVAACAPAPTAREPELWLYYGVDLRDASRVEELERVWVRAAAAGYRRVILADPRLARLDREPELMPVIGRVRRLADSLGLDVIPIVYQVGRSDVMLSDAPDLVEALPVVDAPFVVRDGVAVPEFEPWLRIPDRPSRRDAGVDASPGGVVVRDPGGRARARFDVRVAPRRAYRVAFRVRTRDFHGRAALNVLAGRRDLSLARELRLEPTQDWTEASVPFNSLDHTKAQVWLGCWERGRGTVEFADLRLEPVGPVNVVRRASTPFTLRVGVGGPPLVEGRDYAPVRDSSLGRSGRPGAFDAWHPPPSIRVSLADGTRLTASWHHAAVAYGKQVTCCVSEPAVRERLRREAGTVSAAFEARRAMMMFDEVRALNRDPACVALRKDAGAVLADAARACSGYLPDDTLYVWSDMFDPFHNAIPDYAWVRGDLAGAWEGLERRVRVVNWNGAHRDASLRFFDRQGHGQVIAGYYDGPVEAVADWLRSARGIAGVEAIMYTTWLGRYDDLEAFARACRRR